MLNQRTSQIKRKVILWILWHLKSITLVAVNTRQPGRNKLLVLSVVIAEEVEQSDLFDVDAIFEEFPANCRVDNRAYRIGQNYLF